MVDAFLDLSHTILRDHSSAALAGELLSAAEKHANSLPHGVEPVSVRPMAVVEGSDRLEVGFGRRSADK